MEFISSFLHKRCEKHKNRTLIIGISLVLGFIVSFWSEIIIDYIILPAVIVGLGFILYGQFKYNKGIF